MAARRSAALAIVAIFVLARPCPARAVPAPGDSASARPAPSFSSFREGMTSPPDDSAFPGRFWFEGGFSHAFGTSSPWKPNGYSLDAGVEFGRTISPVFGIGFESHPFAQPDKLAPSGFLGASLVRWTGGGHHTVTTGSVGLRLRAPMGGLEAALEGGVGLARVGYRSQAAVDNDTGRLLQPEFRYSWSGVLGEWGGSIRTRRSRGPDYSIGVRQRGYAQVLDFESSYTGSSLQARFGVIL